MIMKAASPYRRNKTKTFPLWEPSQREIHADILDRFAAHQEKLKAYMARLADRAAAGEVVSSPANPYIVYRLDTAL